MTIVETIDQAIIQLGLSKEAGSLTLIQKADACVSMITAAPVPMAMAVGGGTYVQGTVVQAIGTTVDGGAPYRLDPCPMTWHEHDHRARSQGCTVAPVTSREEMEAVMRAATGLTVWIGAGRHGRGNGPGANHWHWSSGEPWAYTNWCQGEPNNYHAMEDCVQMYGRRELRPPWGMHANDGEWNDVSSAWKGPAVYKVGDGTWTPSPEQMNSGDLISAERLGGCWVGTVLGLMPWAASLEPQGPDTYTRNFQCCLFMPINCGSHYARVGHTSTFKATDDDIEVFSSERCTSFTPTPGCGVRIC